MATPSMGKMAFWLMPSLQAQAFGVTPTLTMMNSGRWAKAKVQKFSFFFLSVLREEVMVEIS